MFSNTTQNQGNDSRFRAMRYSMAAIATKQPTPIRAYVQDPGLVSPAFGIELLQLLCKGFAAGCEQCNRHATGQVANKFPELCSQSRKNKKR